ncbi:beta-ketoacyl-[acyl-carrier-protein] synthase family protein [Sedimenticola hydrogenitrophicus]|uniref:beta-ketoacyl-[acyl-carrier-protein] synthase family protein n=1 Tax=Sedimenticola hydrogenitrophicus TaxID=2967975 RepID=UPI0023AED063|nr:beta-ketoacyl-[acyl-carrier-protein] synthase family protein [Sedimenticola hydrogenitrophicus]
MTRDETSRVVVTGLGSVSALGLDTDQFWAAVKTGQSGIAPLQGFSDETLKIRLGAQVKGFDAAAHFSSRDLPLLDRYSQFALVACREAIGQAGLEPAALFDAAAVIGTGCGGKETDEITYTHLYKQQKSRAHPFTIPRGMPSAAASQVSMQLSIAGPVFTVSSACSSANHAIAQAALLIRAGVVEVAIAGGTDAPFTYGLLKAWEALRVVSTDNCRPFSADRSGLVLGEGAGMVVLESERHARRRGASILARLAGSGMTADAGHITDPSADGAARAIRAALRDASIDAQVVDYVNAHGTGTLANDRTETEALHRVFGAHAKELMVSSTKAMHGHALGASGGLEFIATVLALRDGIIPPTINFTGPGEGCDLDYVPNVAREKKIRVAISNSFAFGGLNAVQVLQAV